MRTERTHYKSSTFKLQIHNTSCRCHQRPEPTTWTDFINAWMMYFFITDFHNSFHHSCAYWNYLVLSSGKNHSAFASISILVQEFLSDNRIIGKIDCAFMSPMNNVYNEYTLCCDYLFVCLSIFKFDEMCWFLLCFIFMARILRLAKEFFDCVIAN